jgi:hypothetical protein
MKKRALSLVIFLLVLGYAVITTGCDHQRNVGEGKKNEDTSKEPADSDQNTPTKNRPKTKTDTIAIEGNEDTFTFLLLDNPALGFSTYTVQGSKEQVSSSEEGDTMLVYPLGEINPDAFVNFFSPPKGVKTTVEEQAKITKEMLANEGFIIPERVQDTPNRYDWSDVEFDIQKEKDDWMYILGTVSIFQHGDRVYRVIVQYPEDWAEGFLPRVSKMFDDLVWYEE